MTHSPPSDDFSAADPREEKLGELLNDFYDRRRRGEPLTREDFLEQHPQFAAELRVHLSGLDWLDRVRISTSAAQSPPPQSPDVGRIETPDAIAPPQVPGMPDIPGYRVLKQIGRGGMGVVYQAMQESTKRVVALKVLLEGGMASDAQRQRFEREIELAARLRHPNIIPIFESGLADGRMYCAMAFIYGSPLTAHLRDERPSLRERLDLFLKIASAAQYAHQRGVIHRDLKPSNVLIDTDHEPHIFDFGLAKSGDAVDMQASISAQMIGTPAYMSPEQVDGDPGGIDVRTDVYSLGVMLYEMLAGRMPYETNAPMARVLDNIAHAEPRPPQRFNRELDADLAAILLKALEKNKQQRYQSADALIIDLRRWLAGEPISVRPAGLLYLLRRYFRRRRMAAALVVVLLIFTGFAVFTRKTFKELEKTLQQQQLAPAAPLSTPVPDAATVAAFRSMMSKITSPRHADEFISRAAQGDQAALAFITLYKSLTAVEKKQGTPPAALNLIPSEALPKLGKYSGEAEPDTGALTPLEQILKAMLLQLSPIPPMGDPAEPRAVPAQRQAAPAQVSATQPAPPGS